jgi:hypothetical protein
MPVSFSDVSFQDSTDIGACAQNSHGSAPPLTPAHLIELIKDREGVSVARGTE